jgi:uncharacterized protein (TIGR00255 family)
MNSMTGFGAAKGECLGRHFTVEVRSFNHRFLEVKLRLPPGCTDPLLDQLLREVVRKKVQRGSLVVTISETTASVAAPAVRLDRDLLLAYAQAVREATMALHAGPELAVERDARLLQLVLAQPGVMSTADTLTHSAEEYLTQLSPILEAALDKLDKSRTREGDSLRTDLLGRIQIITRLRDEVAKMTALAPEQQKRRLSERLQRLVDGQVPVDQQRLAQEVALFADRVDVSEELTRLRAHLDEFVRLCESQAPVGRQLDFLMQEMNREANTLTSKAQSAEVAARVVAMKAELERLREQVQNVE